jgi:hypothetical protein
MDVTMRHSINRRLVVLGLAGVLIAGCAGSPGHRTGAAPGAPAAPTGRSTAVTAPASSSTSTTMTATTATTALGPATPCGASGAPPAHDQHVVWVWMENHSWSQVIGTPDAPYLTSLARRCGTDDHDAAVGSPSLPNYLAATSGSTQGIADDGDPGVHSVPANNVFRQVRAAGGTERSFVESMPEPCALVSAGAYAAKHNPAVYYDGPGDRSACTADDVPFSGLASLLASGTLPTFTSITPDICDDMHDCSVATGDRWLSTWLPRLLASASYRSGTTAVFVVWDEPTPVADVVIAPSVHPGTVSPVPLDHYSLLRTTEELLGLPLLGHAATATSMRPAFGL